MTDELHVGDIGTVLSITVTEATSGVAIDLSAATETELIFRKPSGETLQVTAVFATDGTDGVLRYTFVEDDLDEAGTWRVQAFVEFASGSWYSAADTFRVERNLDTVVLS